MDFYSFLDEPEEQKEQEPVKKPEKKTCIIQ